MLSKDVELIYPFIECKSSLTCVTFCCMLALFQAQLKYMSFRRHSSPLRTKLGKYFRQRDAFI